MKVGSGEKFQALIKKTQKFFFFPQHSSPTELRKVVSWVNIKYFILCSNNNLSSCYSKNFGVRLVIKKKHRSDKKEGAKIPWNLPGH